MGISLHTHLSCLYARSQRLNSRGRVFVAEQGLGQETSTESNSWGESLG